MPRLYSLSDLSVNPLYWKLLYIGMKVRWLTIFLLTGWVVCGLHAAVLVTLSSGSQVRANTETRQGDTVRLAVDHGTIELPVSSITSIETVPDHAPQTEKVAAVPEAASASQALHLASVSQALPESFIAGVAQVESALRTNAVSPKGAVGLMQLMPATATELGVKAEDAAENALGGAKYLRELLLRYNGDARLALAAYNAGPGAVDRYHGIPPYPETIAYINRVLRQYEKNKQAETRQQVNR
jgi:soluble lytic murein transglycosylase-like protein